MLIIGSHVSYGKDQLLGSVKEAISYGANTFMFYTGAPTNTVRKDISDDLTMQAYSLMKENGINLENVICHAPYIINLANASSEDKYKFSIDFLKRELNRCELLGIKYLVLHPGSAVGITPTMGIDNIISALNQIITKDTKCMILLETMAGKGSEVGRTIEEIKEIIDGINEKNMIGVCVDTCHINDAGYDLNDFESYLEKFNQLIGIDKIHCIHINDSKNEKGSFKDRHANIGFGTIGFDKLMKIINHEKLENVPKILETPYIGNSDDDKERLYPPYKFEIEMIRNGIFNANIMNEIRMQYKKD
ncbi:MAG: deoxyribonuclease IV [Bacilli bacterium]